MSGPHGAKAGSASSAHAREHFFLLRCLIIDVETLAALEQPMLKIPEFQVVERPPRPTMAAQLMAPPKTVLSDGTQSKLGVQTVDTPAVEAHTGEDVPLVLFP